MQDDERPERDERDERSERRERDPADAESPQAAEPPHEPDPVAEPGGAEEFETATWPQQDLDEQPADREPEADSAPPPSEVEAYAADPGAPAAPLAAHSVPATEPGESTRCPRCGTENRPGISFCRNCGQRLVAAGAPATVARPAAPEGSQACPRCGTHNRAGVAFCQNCGANLRGAADGYVPPAVAAGSATPAVAESGGPALLGPAVLLIGAIGIITAWLLPFAVGSGSLWDQSYGRSDGYGIAFWSTYESVPALAEQVYLGLAAAAPLLVLLLVALAIGGFLRPAPAALQLAGLVVALLWAIGLAVLFAVVEVFGGAGGELVDILRDLSPGGIIFMLASLIVIIGALTRIGRS